MIWQGSEKCVFSVPFDFLLFLFVMLAIPATSFAQFGVSITVAPPELVAYSQPICPQEGYLWTPGYWAYGPEGYFWVPGTWVEPPAVGLLWTPGYWGWGNGAYAWNDGYWGPTVGFYGGINYGYGYGGSGYQGGYWRDNQFNYNRSVNNVNARNFHNTYEKTVIATEGGKQRQLQRREPAEQPLDRPLRKRPRLMSVILRQRPHKQGINRPPARTMNYYIRESWQAANCCNIQAGRVYGQGCGGSQGCHRLRPRRTRTRQPREHGNENKAAENKAAASANENKVRTRQLKRKHGENRSAENKAEASRNNENKAAEKKTAELSNKSAENKAAASRQREQGG